MKFEYRGDWRQTEWVDGWMDKWMDGRTAAQWISIFHQNEEEYISTSTHSQIIPNPLPLSFSAGAYCTCATSWRSTTVWHNTCRAEGIFTQERAGENCLFRDAALISSLRVSVEPLREGRQTGGLCCVTSKAAKGTARLLSLRLLACAPIPREGDREQIAMCDGKLQRCE